MLEIDDRYPEFARPYEPIRGRRRHGRLTGNESAFMAQRRLRRLDMTRRGFLTGVGVLIVLTVLMPEAKDELILPKVEPVVIEIEQQTPEPEEKQVIEEPPVIIEDTEPTPTPEKPTPKPKPEKKKNAPVITLDHAVIQPDYEMYMFQTLSFDMKLNDLKGGSATGKLYIDTGSGFQEPVLNKENNIVVTYDPSSVSGNVWSDEISCMILADEGKGIKGRAKIVFDIVYPDGKKDRIESETRPVHAGSFVSGNSSYGDGGYKLDEIIDSETGETRYRLCVDTIIDKTLVDPSKVEIVKDTLFNNSLIISYENGEVKRHTDDGKYHIEFTYISDSPFPNGSYWFYPELSYKEDDYNTWITDRYEYNFSF